MQPNLEERPPNATYECTVGHVIPTDELDSATEVQTLDEGAEVRLCREHGAPISITITRTKD